MPDCPICGKDTEISITPFKNVGRHAHSIFDGITLASCAKCASSWATNPPSQDQLGLYYSKYYAPARIDLGEKLKNWPVWDSRATSLIALGRLFAEFSPGDIFLDIGPGNGAALAAATYMLPQPKLACVEYNEKAITIFHERLGGIFAAQSVEKVLDAFGPGKIKYIYSAHCFEHFAITDLRNTLSTIKTMLHNEGVLSLEVPLASTSKLRVMRANVPHLIFFSPAGLTALLRTLGFKVLLCVKTLGRSRTGNAYVNEHLTREGPNISQAFARRVSALNSGDWIGAKPGLVIKCVVSKGRGAIDATARADLAD